MRVTSPGRDPAPVDTGRPGPAGRHRTIALLVAATLVAGFAAGIGQDLLRGDRADPPQARPLSPAEADTLAGMRQRNWQDRRAGVRAAIGTGAEQVHLVGWVDWQRPMVYLARSGTRPGAVTELVQAVPGLVATRPGPKPATGTAPPAGTPRPAASGEPRLVDPHPHPPVEPPAGGWRLRRPGGDGPAAAPGDPGTTDALVVLLLMLSAQEPDAPELLAGSEARWLRQDRAAGHEVDVLLGPAVPPSPPPPGPPAPGRTPDTSLAAMGGAVQYWLDGQSGLHRLAALLAPGTPVRAELDRQDQTAPTVLDLLGGAAIDPRPVTAAEADTLARLRQRNRAAGGGRVTVMVPTAEATVRGTGWLDWHRPVAYLARSADGTPDGLFWADGTGVATLPAEPAGSGGPPVPAPAAAHWRHWSWAARGDDHPDVDLEVLLNEALSLAGWQRDPTGPLRERARWLRADRVDGTPVDVYEVPRPVESEVAPGEARLRYWVARESGVLRRLEIRTRTGGFGRLDLEPGPVPYLGG